ncbi:unnamed protein product, partial [marine sediment metagenome]
MIYIRLAIVALLAVVMFGGRMVQVSEIYNRHYPIAMYDADVAITKIFTPCSGHLSIANASAGASCVVPNGRVETLRQFTIAVIADVTGGTEDCTFTIETSSDLNSWTAVTSSAISTGSNLTNAAGTCRTAELVLDVVGEYCTRTLDDGVTIEPGGAWRIAVSTTGPAVCTDTLGL